MQTFSQFPRKRFDGLFFTYFPEVTFTNYITNVDNWLRRVRAESFSAILSDDFASIPRVKLGSEGETVFQNIKSSHWVFSTALVE